MKRRVALWRKHAAGLCFEVRAAHSERTLCEHKASNPEWVAPVFSPDSQRIYFQSDRHGKPALYEVRVGRFVEETGAEP